MYSKEEIKKGKERFWTRFGQYLSVIPSAEGEKINWVNYKTGIKHLFFRMDADQYQGVIMIEMANPDAGIRELQFETFKTYKKIFEETVGEDWVWEKEFVDAYGKATTRIYKELKGVNLYNEQDWPELISFFKPRLLALDDFWTTAKYGFSIFK
ncbi:DUF4268 domain-containing protein [Sphingobacterium hungaricum]|uniref:DUF4268 domain-containing protein n=1 Tax=Sphingobacterium hungaricum TaxID=2082723 RepID=A0A928YQ10_9SPHI|nr:DUF4268 domain-containing protein [Sphingobacterium hungaricum]MBE8712485.1 DUF4268 domain-containing protein [Sphingobacterium hungaricum]